VLPNGDAISFGGALSRVAGETVAASPYGITQGTLANTNYTITFTPGVTFAITPLPVTVTATAGQSKVYGNLDPVFAYTSAPAVGFVLPNGDAISFGGALSRVAGETVAASPYGITQGTLANTNYTITFTPGVTFAITPLPVVVTADAKTKVYGEVDPALTFVSAPIVGFVLPNGDAITFGGALSRTAGETVGTWAILQGTLANSNYTITYNGANLTITQRPLTVVGAVAQNKVYDGNTVAVVTGAAPAPFVLAPPSGMMPGDDIFLNNHISGAFQPDGTVANGKPVTTAITLGGTDAANYSFNPATSLTANITARPIVITVTPGQTKVYGEANPVYAYTYATGPNVGLAPGQSFDGLLARAGGETVGSYAINQGTLTIVNPPFGGSIANYNVTFNGDNFAITAKQLTITGAVAQNKVYDGNAAAFVSGAALNGIVSPDVITLVNGTVGTFDNKNVGSNKVVTTNMSATGAAIANYIQPVTPVLSANITQKALTATSVAAGKIYDGTTTAALTSALVGLVGGDDVTLTNGTVGTFASANVGTWAVSNTIGITGADVPNYTWTAPVVAPATISARPLTVNVPTGQSKAYGQPDPVFNYTVTGTLAPGHTWTGALSRTPGENVGTYNYITSPLTITDAGSNNVTANYNITYTAMPAAAGSFAITPATTPLVITADNYTKFRCAADPTFTVTTTGLYFGDAVTADLSRTPAGNDPGTYTINVDSYTVITGNPLNYSNVSTVPGTLTIIDGPADLITTIVGFGNVIVRKQNGSVAAEIDGPVVGTTVSGFSFNEIITLEAVADVGYVFTGWTQDLTGMTNPGTLVMDCGKVVTATFKKVVYQSDIVVVAPNKTYDGNNLVVGGSAYYNGVLYGQGTAHQQPAPAVTWTSATYPNALAENNKLVTFSGLGLVPNTYYQLAPGVVTQTTTSSILKKNLTVINASVPSRPYNGTAIATIINAEFNPADMVGTESTTLVIGSHTTGTFAGTAATGVNSGANVSNNKNVVTAMTVTGPTAANYTLIQPTLTGDVTPRTLTFTAVTITPKPFDGNTTATVASVGASTTWSGLISGDAAKFSVNVSGASASFNNQWPGTGKPVTVSGGIAMSTNVGHTATYNAGNYEIVYPINTTGTILPPAYAMFTPTYAVNRPFVPVQNVPINTPLKVEFSVNVVDINGDALPTNDLGDFIDFQFNDGFNWIDVAGWSATRSNRTITITNVGMLNFATQYRIVFTGVYIAGTAPLSPLVYTLDGETRDNTLANALVVGNEVRFNTMSEYTWTLPVVTPFGPNIGVCNKTIVLTFRNPVEYRNGNQITDNPKHKFTLQANSGSGWNDVPAADWSVAIDVPGNPKVFTFNYVPSQFAYNTEYRVRMNVSLVDGLRGFTDKVYNYPNQAWMDSEFASVHTQGSGWNWTTTGMYPLTVAVTPVATGFGATPYNAVTVGGVGTYSTTATFNVGVASATMTMTPVASEGYKFVNWERTLDGGANWSFYTVSNTWTFNAAAQAPLCTQGLGFRATFVIKNYKVERSPIANTAGGIVSVTGMTNTINSSTTGHNHGTAPVWTATPAPGKKLASWSTNVPGATLPAVPDAYATLTPAPGVASFTFNSPSLVENVTYTFTAIFDTWTPRLKASAGFAGTGTQPATMIGLIQFTTNFVSSISNPGQESGLFQGLQYEQVDVKYDTLVTLLAHGAPCEYQFIKWQYYNPSTLAWVDYVSAGNPLGANPITFKMDQNIRFKAVYQMRTNVNVSATAMNPALGTVIIFSDAARTNPIHINDVNGGNFAPGTTLYITSFPEPDYYTWRWDIVGGVTNTSSVVLQQRYEDRSEWTYTVGCFSTHLKAVIGPKEYQIIVRSESGTRGTVETSIPAFTANTSGMPGRGLGFSFTTGVGGNTATTKVYGEGWFQRTIAGVNTSSVTFRATDKTDWAFAYWRVTGTTTDAGIVSYDRNYTVNNIQTGMDLTAVFVSTLPPAPTYAVSVMANPAAGASALFGAGNYVANSSPGAVSVTATFSVAPGYTFTNWTAQGVSLVTPTLTTQTFAMPANTVTVTANFVPTQYTVQANVRTYLRATPIDNFTVVSYGGTVTPATGTFTFGQTATFTATPLPGFRFVNWMEGEIVSGDGRILRGRQLTESTTLNYVVPPVMGNPLRNVYAIFVEIAIPEYPRLTLTTAANPVGYGVVTGAGTYAYGIQALVGQTPTQPGWEFVNWSNNVTTTPVAYVNMTSNQTAVANYGLKNYYLNVYAIGAGTVSGTGSFTVESLPMPVAATPSTGDCNYTYAFMGWFTNALGTIPLTDAGGNVITDPQFNFIPYALPGTQTSVNIWAKFGTVSNTYTVTAATALNTPANLNNSVGTTTITGPTAPYVNGTNLVISTTPAAGYAFQYWTDPTNTLYITQQTFNHEVNCESMQFIAVYEAINYTVTASAQMGGTVTPVTATYTIGQTATVVAAANMGYQFDGWEVVSGTVTFTATSLTATFVMPASNVVLLAKFSKIPYTVTATAETGGTATPATQIKYYGDAVTVTANALPGYTFNGWVDVVGATVTNTMNPLSFTMPNNNVSLKASFVANPYTVSVIAVPANGGTFSAVNPSYTVGQTVSVTATPAAGFEFTGWTAVGVTPVNLASPTVSFTMPAGNVTLTATFAPLGNTLTGSIKYFNQFESMLPVKSDFTVGLYDGTSLVGTSTLNASGRYEFTGIQPGLNYTVRVMASGINTPFGGVSAADALIANYMVIQSPILASFPWIDASGVTPPVYTPFANKVADVNSMGGVTALDALTILYRTVNNITAYPNTPDFQVAAAEVPSYTAKTYPQAPGNVFSFAAGAYSGSWTGKAGQTIMNLYFVSTGDINASYVPQSAKAKVNLNYSGQISAKVGDVVSIPVSIDQSAQLGAMTLGLSFNNNLLEVLSVEGYDVYTVDNKNGTIRIADMSLNAKNVSANENIVIITAKVLAPIEASTRYFEIDEAEFNDRTAAPIDGITLTTKSITGEALSVLESGEMISSAYPNPFKDMATINFTLPEAGKVTIVVYNKFGQEVKTLVNDNREAGVQYKVELNSYDLTGSGTYFYRILVEGTAKTYTANGTLILVK
ncbi:MAG: MBG domain-containing protein, partial [Bacteroidales bacterium]|nr:MBG domain-containing protein [Bacteroidales bacterium]